MKSRHQIRIVLSLTPRVSPTSTCSCCCFTQAKSSGIIIIKHHSQIHIQICPAIFSQIFAINDFIHGQQFPLVYALLLSKSRSVNNRMFTFLKEELQNLGLQLNSQTVMADFELALVQSLELQFPGTAVQGCFFHFSQCMLMEKGAVTWTYRSI